jgi:hypothetical protein
VLPSIQNDLRGIKAPLLALIIPVAFLVGQSFFRHGWLDMALGQFAIIFWIAAIAWAAALLVSLRRKQWWALLSAPLALYPIVGVALLLYECAQGNCL